MRTLPDPEVLVETVEINEKRLRAVERRLEGIVVEANAIDWGCVGVMCAFVFVAAFGGAALAVWVLW